MFAGAVVYDDVLPMRMMEMLIKGLCVIMFTGMFEASTKYIHGSCALSTQLREFRVMAWLACQSMYVILRMQMWRLYCLIVRIRRTSHGYMACIGQMVSFCVHIDK